MPTSRPARFTEALTLADLSDQVVLEMEGDCRGQILTQSHGDGGFGYNPFFYLPEAQPTFAEMPKGLNLEVGHRGRAIAALGPSESRNRPSYSTFNFISIVIDKKLNISKH